MDGPSVTLGGAAAVPWTRSTPPERILAIRLQALGDVVVTLPYLSELSRSFPQASIDFVTRGEDAGIPESLTLFRRVLRLEGGRDARRQLARALALVPALRAERYDAVLDLQGSRLSRLLRRAVAPEAWATFDRFSPVSAGERTRRTIEAAGFRLDAVRPGLALRADAPASALRLLAAAGRDEATDLVILSPAGSFPTRSWPLESWAAFGASWARRHGSQLAVLGLPPLAEKARALREAIGAPLLDLVGKTTAAEALAIVGKASLAVAEDGGLMHMAWVSGVPTLALFGGSPHVWSAPVGDFTRCLHSGDLPCGACQSATCRYGDVRCLTRYTAERVVAEAESLLAEVAGRERFVARL